MARKKVKTRTKTSKRIVTKTEKLRRNFNAKIKRMEKAGINVAQTIKDMIKSARYNTLNMYHKDRYREFNKLVKLTTVKAPKQHEANPVELLRKLQKEGFINAKLNDHDKTAYINAIKYALSYDRNELRDIYKTSENKRERFYATQALWLKNKSPEMFNSRENYNENLRETEDIIFDTKQLVWDSVVELCERGLSGTAYEQWCATQLLEMLYNERDTMVSAGKEQEFYKSIEMCDGELLERAEQLIYDSENIAQKRESLLAIMYLIRGYYDTDMQMQASALDELLESDITDGVYFK